MFRKAKRRIVISILAILGAVLVGTLGMIYLSSYLSVTSQNYQVLEKHAGMLTNGPRPVHNNGIPENGPHETGQFNERGDGKMDRHLEIGTFYAVRISEDGAAAVIENGADGLYSNEELIELAGSVSADAKGKTGELLYVVKQADSGTIVCFMDNTVFTDSFTRLFLFTLLFGVLAIIAISFISVHIANRIVSPMEETYKKQKQFTARSEERRVGKECRSGWSPYH